MHPKDLNNGVINACFLLLFKDLIKLYACYNDGIINLLGKESPLNFTFIYATVLMGEQIFFISNTTPERKNGWQILFVCGNVWICIPQSIRKSFR